MSLEGDGYHGLEPRKTRKATESTSFSSIKMLKVAQYNLNLTPGPMFNHLVLRINLQHMNLGRLIILGDSSITQCIISACFKYNESRPQKQEVACSMGGKSKHYCIIVSCTPPWQGVCVIVTI